MPRRAISLLSIVVVFSLGGCVTQQPATPSALATATPTATPTATATAEATTSVAPVPDPQAVVQAFYDWYLADGNYEDLLARPELTSEFVQYLTSFSGGYDAIVCAQDVPDSVQADPADISGSSATVPTTVSFGGSPGQPGQTVDLTLGPTGWQISMVNCGLG